MDATLKKIYTSALKFLEPLSADETYKVIVKEGMKLVGAQYGSIFLKRKGGLERVYASSPILYQNKIRKRGFTYTAAQSDRASIIKKEELAKVHPHLAANSITSTIFIPLSYKNKSLGVLSIDRSSDTSFTKNDLAILQLYGSLASLAIRKTQLYNEAQQALQIRDVFLSMAAHELRTPITTINGYVQLLYNVSKDKETQEANWIKKLYAENIRLTTLVKELLEVNRIKTGKMNFVWEECHLKELAQKVIEYFRLRFPMHTVEIIDKIENGEDIIIGDHDKLIHALSNVLENAAKYSSVRSVITISLVNAQKYLGITIRDEGVGMTKEELKKIFTKFSSDKHDEDDGFGIGLYLVKNIIDKHQGKIKISSTPNQGTTVSIRLPHIKL